MNEIIRKVVKGFNFEKVLKAMTTVNWTWLGEKEPPSMDELVLWAMDLLEEAYEMDIGHSISTGGFTATKLKDTDGKVGLCLEFVLTEYIFYYEEN